MTSQLVPVYILANIDWVVIRWNISFHCQSQTVKLKFILSVNLTELAGIPDASDIKLN